eukprot:GHUV01029178.1.p2 GENE.GHUV01029178.1~~GHUV01029178.1.p2  ORF type:complete len:111 (-),score=24.78 GHUV01029178.1:80-412(-)
MMCVLLEPYCPVPDAFRYTGVQLSDDQVLVLLCQLLQVWCIRGVTCGGNDLVVTLQELLNQASANTPAFDNKAITTPECDSCCCSPTEQLGRRQMISLWAHDLGCLESVN